MGNIVSIDGWKKCHEKLLKEKENGRIFLNLKSILNWQVIKYSFKIPQLSHIYTIMVIVMMTTKPQINLRSSSTNDDLLEQKN